MIRPSALLLIASALAAAPLRADADRLLTAETYEVGRNGHGVQLFQLSGSCALTMTPDHAIVLGGVAAQAVKPTEATEQLDKQIGVIRDLVTREHGTLVLLERARTVKVRPPGTDDHELPFEVVQRLQAAFPARAPVDPILERMIEAGLDRFGDRVLNTNGSSRETAVRYVLSGFGARLKGMQQRCTADAWKRWCATPEATGACPTEDPPKDLQMQSFTVRSAEKLLAPDGEARYWTFTFTPMQRATRTPELLGNVAVHLSGEILLTYRREEAP